MSSSESLGKTLKVVVAVCLVCSVIVSGAAVGLRSTQEANKVADQQKNILAISGIDLTGKKPADVYADNIEPKVVDLATGEYTDAIPADSYNAVALAKDKSTSTKLTKEQGFAGFSVRENYGLVYLVKDDAGQLQRIIIPVRGAGLWNMMYAFVALKPDGNTVEALTYYQHGETPGLGGEVDNPLWKAKWPGKKLFDDNGKPAIKIVKGGAPKGDIHGVDGLSGATLTGVGIQKSFDFWLGADGFGPYLKKLGKGELSNG